MALIKNDGPIPVYMYVSQYMCKQHFSSGVAGGIVEDCWVDFGNSGGEIKPGSSRYISANLMENVQVPIYVSAVSPNSDDCISYCQISPHDIAVFDGATVRVNNGYTGLTEPREGW